MSLGQQFRHPPRRVQTKISTHGHNESHTLPHSKRDGHNLCGHFREQVSTHIKGALQHLSKLTDIELDVNLSWPHDYPCHRETWNPSSKRWTYCMKRVPSFLSDVTFRWRKGTVSAASEGSVGHILHQVLELLFILSFLTVLAVTFHSDTLTETSKQCSTRPTRALALSWNRWMPVVFACCMRSWSHCWWKWEVLSCTQCNHV